MALVITNKTINKYLGFLSRLDKKSKKLLIKKLADSIDDAEKRDFDFKKLYGAWQDKRSSDEIIKDIKHARVDKDENINF